MISDAKHCITPTGINLVHLVGALEHLDVIWSIQTLLWGFQVSGVDGLIAISTDVGPGGVNRSLSV